MAYLGLLVLGLLLYVIISALRNNRSDNPPPGLTTNDLANSLAQRDAEWIKSIRTYIDASKSPTEKKILERIISDYYSSGTASESVKTAIVVGENAIPQENTNKAVVLPANTAPSVQVKTKSQIQLDNASLLLYFGAFLFIASTGLFVVFGGLTGGIRIFIVSLVAAVMYCSGIWLYHDRPKLKQAGLAFAGIGMAITPLIGLTAYSYLFNKSHAPEVWFGTSVLCLALYIHALIVLRKPLINYIFIFTFLSLFESSVSLVNAPIYYFGWMMAAVGIGLLLVSHLKGFWPELKESTWNSSTIILPLAILVSIILTPNHGYLQLGVSLLLAAAYYGLEALIADINYRKINSVVSQITAILGISSLIYGHYHSLKEISVGIIVICLAQLLIVLFSKRDSLIARNFATVIVVSQIIGLCIGGKSHLVVLVSAIALAIESSIIYIWQKRYDAYAVASFSLFVMSFVLGQLVLQPHLLPSEQAGLLFEALLVQLVVFIFVKKRLSINDNRIADVTYLVSSILVILTSLWAGPWVGVTLSTLVALCAVMVAHRYKHRKWAVISGILVLAPLILGWKAPGAFLACNVIGLLLNIVLSLSFRTEANRWISTLLWLLLPLSLGNGILGSKWTVSIYALAYLLITITLLISRTIARGMLFLSDKIPVISFAKSASMSYVYGYWLAAATTVILAMLIKNGRLLASAILVAVALLIWITSHYVEKQIRIITLLPIIYQIILWSIIRPNQANLSLIIFLILSTLISLIGYFWGNLTAIKQETVKYLQFGSLATIFVTPISAEFVHNSYWPMPIGLIIAGLLLYYHFREQKQTYKDLVGFVVTIGIFWTLGFLHVHAVQVYTHILAIQLVIYAYWRHMRAEEVNSKNYTYAALAVATIPLAIQAIGGQAGGLYGWWLLIEQVVIMLIGMSIGKKYVVYWGLYVAVGAVLYQLRNLGWAALTVLAVFLIGLAIHKIIKNS